MDNNLPTSPTLAALKTRAAHANEAAGSSRGLLLTATLVTLALWYVPYSDYLLYPLRLFITFIHESGHALATIVTGGNVAYLKINTNGSGVTYSTVTWAQWLVNSGGYLGTTLFGALMLQVGRLSRWKNAGRTALYAAAAYIALVTLLWAHNPFTNLFTLAAGLVIAGMLWGLARVLSPRAANFAASFLAVQCCLNALGDLRILLTYTTYNLGDNDAKNMALAYGLTPTFWALLWVAIALVMLGASLRSYLRATAANAKSSALHKY